jgi:plastocyanin
MSRLFRVAVPLGLLLVLFAQQGAMAATTSVSITEFMFTPSAAKARIGDSVKWTNNGTVSHTSTSDGIDACCPNGASLWMSGTLTPGSSFTEVFAAAGGYAYHCSIHTTMKGTVSVLGVASPRSGGTTTVFTINWASAAGVPTGFTEDIQIKRPNSNTFVTWKSAQGAGTKSATFTPDVGTGIYQFRMRLNNVSTGKSSLFSPAVKIQVS